MTLKAPRLIRSVDHRMCSGTEYPPYRCCLVLRLHLEEVLLLKMYMVFFVLINAMPHVITCAHGLSCTERIKLTFTLKITL